MQTKGYGPARNRPRRKPHPQKPRVGHPAQGKPALQSMVRICPAFGPDALKRRLYKSETNGLAIVTVVVLLMFLGVDSHAHPGMDAALELGVLSLAQEGAGCVRICRDKDVFWTWRLWHELAVHHACALRSGNRVPDAALRGATTPPPNSRTRVNVCVSPPRFWSMMLRPSSLAARSGTKRQAPTDFSAPSSA